MRISSQSAGVPLARRHFPKLWQASDGKHYIEYKPILPDLLLFCIEEGKWVYRSKLSNLLRIESINLVDEDPRAD